MLLLMVCGASVVRAGMCCWNAVPEWNVLPALTV